ncbi:MAG: NosD domain-containing protein, partial [Halobacteria archaeon]
VNASVNNTNGTSLNLSWTVTVTPPAPAIVSQSNNVTNDSSLSITINVNQTVFFNATADQAGQWTWRKNGTLQKFDNVSNTTNNFTVNFTTAGAQNVSVNVSNANGTSSTLLWNVTVDPGAPPADPYAVWGFLKNESGNPIADHPVILVETNTSCKLNATTASDGSFTFDLASCGAGGYYRNDTVVVNATNQTLGAYGESEAPVSNNTSVSETKVNVTRVPEPLWRKAGSNETVIRRPNNDTVLLFAQGVDGRNLTNATLYTNETGVFAPSNSANNSTGANSTFLFALPNSAEWLASNFTWRNTTLPEGTRIGWWINYTDDEGRTNNTTLRTFLLLGPTPGIDSFGNNKTNNNTTGVFLNTSEPVLFNATANQSGNWTWRQDGAIVNQTNGTNATNYSTSFASGAFHNVSVEFANVNGSASVLWNVTVDLPPAAVANLTASAIGVAYVNWTWTNPTDSDFTCTNVSVNGTFLSCVAGTPGGASFFNYTNFTANVSQAILARAQDANGNVNLTQITNATFTLADPPPAPAVTATSPSSLNVLLNTASNPAATEFAVNVTGTATGWLLGNGSVGPSAEWRTFANWGGASGANATGLLTNRSYTFAVRARNGNLTETVLSAGTSNFTLADRPTNLSAVSVQSNAINLTWSNNTNTPGVSIEVFRNGALIANLSGANSYSDAVLAPNTSYTYVVGARNANGLYNNSTMASNYTHAAAPASVQALTITATQINVTWSNNSNPAGAPFEVFRDGVLAINTTATLFADTGRSPSTSYNYTVGARNANGLMNNSTPAPNTTYGVPVILSFSNNKTQNNTTSLTLNTSEYASLNATANQTIATWTWRVDGADLGVNNDTLAIAWPTIGTRTLNVSGANPNGTTQNVSWTVNVVAQPGNRRVVNQSSGPACAQGVANYTSIQAAINAAVNGDEVVVCAGTYTESLVVNKSIALRANNTTYDVTVNASLNNQVAVNITASGVNVSWLVVQNSTSGDIGGIRVGADMVNVSYNKARSNYKGIFLDRVNNTSVAWNIAENNSDDGIFLQFTNYSLIANNTARSNLNNGICLGGTKNYFNSIRDNLATGNTNYGTFLVDSHSNNFQNNNFSYNSDGVHSTGSSTANNFTNDVAKSNSVSGFRFINAANGSLTGVLALNNSNGIHFDSSSNGSVNNSNSSQNGKHGVFLFNSSGISVSGTVLSFNNNSGLFLESSASNSFTGNNIYNNTVNGTGFFNNGGGNLLQHNNIHNNTGFNLNYSQTQPVNASPNWWGSTICTLINASISNLVNVTYRPFLDGPNPGGNPTDCQLPSILQNGNSKTGNSTPTLYADINESITFNVTANQAATTWNWTRDWVNQSGFSGNGTANASFTTNFTTNGTHTVSVNGTNIEGTTQTIVWTVIVNGTPNILAASPASPVATNLTDSSLQFNLTSNQTVNVTWSVNGTAVQVNNTSLGNAGTFVRYVNITPSTGYWNVTAFASNANGNRQVEWLWRVVDDVPPGPVTNLANTSGSEFINWTWTDPGGDWNHTQVFINGTPVANVTAGYYNVNVSANVSVAIHLRTVDRNFTANLTNVTDTAFSRAIVPGGVAVTAVNNTSLNATWTSAGNPAGTRYIVVRDGAVTVCADVLAFVCADSNAVPALGPNTSHTYVVSARNGDNILNSSGGVANFTLASVPGTPSAVPVNNTTINVSWAPAGNPAGTEYQVFNITGGLLNTTPLTYHLHGGLIDNTFSDYWVRAKNGAGVFSNNSSNATATTPDQKPPFFGLVTANLTAVNVSDAVNFSGNWTDNVALKNYTFHWNASGPYCNTFAAAGTVSFSGTANLSSNVSAIPATCAGKTIGFFFVANDTSGNLNATAVNTTRVNKYDLAATLSNTTLIGEVRDNLTLNLTVRNTGTVADVYSVACSAGGVVGTAILNATACGSVPAQTRLLQPDETDVITLSVNSTRAGTFFVSVNASSVNKAGLSRIAAAAFVYKAPVEVVANALSLATFNNSSDPSTFNAVFNFTIRNTGTRAHAFVLGNSSAQPLVANGL